MVARRVYCRVAHRHSPVGSGCDCHEEEILAGCKVDCHMKGRRLPRAFNYGMRQLRRMLAIAIAWGLSTFGGDATLLQQAQGCIRGIYHLGERQLAYLNCIPYAFARLREPGMRALGLAQYRSAAASLHHRVSNLWCAGGVLLRDMLHTGEGGRCNRHDFPGRRRTGGTSQLS